MNINESLKKIIEEKKEQLFGEMSSKNEYIKLYSKMSPISNKSVDFKLLPSDLLENFDYEVDLNDGTSPIIDLDQLFAEFPSKANYIIIIDGYYSKKYSKILSDKLEVVSFLEETTKQKDMFMFERHFTEYYEYNENQLTVINSIFSMDGTYVNIPDNTIIEEPIYIFNLVSEQKRNIMLAQKKLIHIGENSQAKIIETYLSFSQYKTLLLNVFLMHQAASSTASYLNLNSDFLSDDKNKHYSFSNGSVIGAKEFKLAKNAKLTTTHLCFGSSFVRNRTDYILNEEGAELKTSFLAICKNNKISDIKTRILHEAPHSKSNQLVKAICADNSNFVFDGTIRVGDGAIGTDATQNSKGIILNENAQINFKPQLKIYNDDVVCSHGSAIGSIDKEAIYYLNSRGIDTENSKKLLLKAFANEVIDRIPNRSEFEEFIEKRKKN